MSGEIAALTMTAAALGAIHTLLGPDHYVPFLAMGRARGWSVPRAIGVTLLCGSGHVAVTIGAVAALVAAGRSVAAVTEWDPLRSNLASGLLLAFGIGYALWGVRRGLRPESDSPGAPRRDLTTWVLFLVFAFGPCEALLPLVVFPLSRGLWTGAALVAGVFALATLATMTLTVAVGYAGARRVLPSASAERWSHAFAGAALTACGIALRLGL